MTAIQNMRDGTSTSLTRSPTIGSKWIPSWQDRLLDWLSNGIAWGVLVALLLFGYFWEWKLPAFRRIFQKGESSAVDWCSEHSVPATKCIECNPLLAPKPRPLGFCRVHGVAECVIDHPELAQVSGPPTLPKYETFKAIGIRPRKENNSRDQLHSRRVQFSSKESLEKAGVDVAVVSEQPMSEFASANAELVFDPTRVARLSTRIAGSVIKVFRQIGDQIGTSEVLALIDAADVGRAKSQLAQAIVQLQLRKTTVDRLRSIATEGVVPQKTALEAETSLQEAQVAFITARQGLANLGFELPNDLEKKSADDVSKELMFLGLEPEVLASVTGSNRTANLIPIRSPIDGMVVSSDVVVGEVVQLGPTLFTVADPTKMWLMMNFRQEDLVLVRLGARVNFKADSIAQSATGAVTWISPTIDDRTRTIGVRAIVSNVDGAFKNNTFGTANVLLREQPNAIVVPQQAIQSTNDSTYVFVRDKNFFVPDSPLFFHVRQVRVGASGDGVVELLAGVLPGEVVASKGSTAILAQLLKSNLGAGCGCCEE